MRPGAPLVLAGVLLAPLPAAAESSPEWAYVCSGEALGQGGESLSVAIYVDKDGKPAASSALWVPPFAGDVGRGDLDRPDVSFTVAYQGISASSIGQPSRTDLGVGIFSPLRDRNTSRQLGDRLASYSGQYRFGENAFVPMERLTQRPDMDIPGSAQSSQAIDLPVPAPSLLDVQVSDAKHKVVTTVRFDLRGGAARDALLDQAWNQAETARANFKSCPQAGEP